MNVAELKKFIQDNNVPDDYELLTIIPRSKKLSTIESLQVYDGRKQLRINIGEQTTEYI